MRLFCTLLVLFASAGAFAADNFSSLVTQALKKNGYNPQNLKIYNSTASVVAVAVDAGLATLNDQKVTAKGITFTNEDRQFACVAVVNTNDYGAKSVDVFRCKISYDGRNLIPPTIVN